MDFGGVERNREHMLPANNIHMFLTVTESK